MALVKCTWLAVYCYSKHQCGFSTGNLNFCVNLLIDLVIVDLIVLKLVSSLWQIVLNLVSSCGESRPKYSTHKNLYVVNRQCHPQHWTPSKQRMTCCLKDLNVSLRGQVGIFLARTERVATLGS